MGYDSSQSGYHERKPGMAGLDDTEDWGDDFDEDECESMDDLEMGFDPYEGGYTWDC